MMLLYHNEHSSQATLPSAPVTNLAFTKTLVFSLKDVDFNDQLALLFLHTIK